MSEHDSAADVGMACHKYAFAIFIGIGWISLTNT
jgi:hypothetical protein